MKKRTIIIAVLLLALALSFTGCGNEAKTESLEIPAESTPVPTPEPTPIPEPTPTPEPTPPPFMPLSLQEQNRLYCSAHRFEYDGKIYSNFFNNNLELHFGCVEKGKGRNDYVQLFEDPAVFCEVIDGNFYILTGQCEDSVLYRCSLDMSETEALYTIPNCKIDDYMQYYDGYFYYAGKNTDYHYYRLPIDGGEPELILDKAVYYPLIHDGWLLYQDDADGESLHWMELSSGDDYKITSIPSCSAYLDGDYIYFSSKYETSYIYRIRHDGTDQQIINETNSYGDLGIDENYIYFVEDKPVYDLYRMEKDGSNVTHLGIEPYNEDPYIVDGTVYLKHVSDTMEYYYGYKYLDAETGEYIKSLN